MGLLQELQAVQRMIDIPYIDVSGKKKAARRFISVLKNHDALFNLEDDAKTLMRYRTSKCDRTDSSNMILSFNPEQAEAINFLKKELYKYGLMNLLTEALRE